MGTAPVKVSKCRSCQAPIVWARCKNRAGEWKSIPFDLEPTDNGNYLLFYPGGDKRKLHGRYVGRGEEWPPGSLPRTNHFVTCPERKQWRRTSTEKPKTDEEREAESRAKKLVDETVERQRKEETP